MASRDFRKRSISFLGKDSVGHLFHMVGFSTLCCWRVYRVGADQVDRETGRVKEWLFD